MAWLYLYFVLFLFLFCSYSCFAFLYSDPKYVGYQPLDDDQVVAAKDVFVGNYEYFPESASVGKQFVNKYISDRQVKYHEANETTSNLKYGAVFFFVTCILDEILFVM